jgi:hypothetical protein
MVPTTTTTTTATMMMILMVMMMKLFQAQWHLGTNKNHRFCRKLLTTNIPCRLS